MGLLNLLPGSKLGLKGGTPAKIAGSNGASTLHYQYSINGTPKQNQPEPSPSKLDLGGAIPKMAPSGQKLPYVNNEPK